MKTLLVTLTAVALLTVGAATAQNDPLADRDGDGIAASIDGCPATPPGARALVRGCAAVEISGRPDRFLRPLDRVLDDAITQLRETSVPGKAGLVSSLEASRMAYDPALAQLADAHVCPGADAAEAASFELGAEVARVQSALASAQSELLRQARGAGDFDETDLTWHELAYAARLLGDVRRAADESDDAFRAACREVDGPLTGTRRVVGTDDARHLVELDGGFVASRPAAGDVWLGRQGQPAGVKFTDGTGALSALGDVPAIPGELGGGLKIDCTFLRIAPIQPFEGYLPGGYVLYKPAAYTWYGVVLMEQGMRLAAESGQCPTMQGPQVLRYSAKLRLTYTKTNNSKKVLVLASDLDKADDPIELPANLDVNYPAELEVVQRHQACTGIVAPGGGGSLSCGPPVEYSSHTFPIDVNKRGSYANAYYSRTGFGLEYADADDFQTAKVTAIGLTGPPGAADPAFHADGYSGSGSGQIVDIEKGEPFAVYRDDFFDPEAQVLFAPDEATGIPYAAGLSWPRIEGIHNGSPFRYSVVVPRIARDVVNLCTPGPDAYYRPPWENGVLNQVTQGNNNAFTHNGSGKYAFDFSLENGETIYAARRGTVTYVEESNSKTSDPSKVKAGLEEAAPSNALYIEHDDGTKSRYAHMQKDGVLVDEGETVLRGQPVGITGNVGNSTGPHLHFQVNKPSIEIRFEALRSEGLWDELEKCTIPEEGEFYWSTNPQP